MEPVPRRIHLIFTPGYSSVKTGWLLANGVRAPLPRVKRVKHRSRVFIIPTLVNTRAKFDGPPPRGAGLWTVPVRREDSPARAHSGHPT